MYHWVYFQTQMKTSLFVFLKTDNSRGEFRTGFCEQFIQTGFWISICSSARVARKSLKSSRIHKDYRPENLMIFRNTWKCQTEQPSVQTINLDSDYLH